MVFPVWWEVGFCVVGGLFLWVFVSFLVSGFVSGVSRRGGEGETFASCSV